MLNRSAYITRAEALRAAKMLRTENDAACWVINHTFDQRTGWRVPFSTLEDEFKMRGEQALCLELQEIMEPNQNG